MRKPHWLVLALVLGIGAPVEAASADHVVLVHGIMNKPFVMSRLSNALTEKGYQVHNWGYPSTGGLIEDHARNLNQYLQSLKPGGRIHFVGFSQGAIIIRYLLTHHRVERTGRFVMIAPPNHGSEVAEAFYEYAWFRGLYGDKSIKQLFAKQNDFLKEVGTPRVEFGIIAGGRGDANGFSAQIPGDDDGTISVASARLDGAKDFVPMPHLHTPLVFAAGTAEQTLHFLEHGRFNHSKETP
jgi:pimeloyl-ACP methyl ester carboxylesterase